MLTHFDKDGKAIMVDITEKKDTKRLAITSGKIFMNEDTFNKVKEGDIKKGDVLGIARVAGIMASKKTSDLIPLCHPLPLTGVKVNFELNEAEKSIKVISEVATDGKTGVEMEGLVATSTALLTIYDMCKAMDKGMIITEIKLNKKLGGKSGEYINE